jgi:hypothetical protein
MEILSEQVFAALQIMGPINGKGEGRRLLHDFRQLRLAQHTIASSLGMTPASRQAIRASSANVALDLVARMACSEGAEDANDE